ncbi:MAG: DUF4864 domain-containing protein [Rhodospirillales bacterium]
MKATHPAATIALILSFWSLLFTSGSMAADPDHGAIKSVIERQLAAFQNDDAALAYSFATPKIQQTFGSPEQFISMVRSGYPPVYRPQSVTFLDIIMLRGQLTQRVLLTGPDGVPTTAHYFMEQQEDGRWLIDGCVLSAPDALSAGRQTDRQSSTG